MGKFAKSAAAVVVSSGLVAGFTAMPAEAFTKKELKICWFNNTGDPVDARFVADGPSYRRVGLPSGLCKNWDVRPGQYKITLEDPEDFLADISAATCDPGFDETFLIRVKRAGQQYRNYPFHTFVHGDIVTNVKKNRATTVAIQLKCVPT